MNGRSVDEVLERLRKLAINLYPEIAIDVEIVYGKLRIYLALGETAYRWHHISLG